MKLKSQTASWVLVGNFNFGIGLQCRALPILGKIFGAHTQAPTHQGSPGRTLQKLSNLSQKQRTLLTVNFSIKFY